MPPMPKVKIKHWGKADKKHLAKLISVGDINISDTSYLYILRTCDWSILNMATSGISVKISETLQHHSISRPSTPVLGNTKQVKLQYLF
jgi:hypothetical protein